MEIDLQTINSNSVQVVSNRTDTSSSRNESTKVKARTEESVKSQQAAKATACKIT